LVLISTERDRETEIFGDGATLFINKPAEIGGLLAESTKIIFIDFFVGYHIFNNFALSTILCIDYERY